MRTSSTLSTRGAAGLARPAHYYFSRSYRMGEPRVILLVGESWKTAMRRHYGIDHEPFFSRFAYAGEPDHYRPSGHPWGWVFRPEKVLEYERASGQLDQLKLQELRAALQAQVAAIPFAPECAQALGRATRERATEMHA
jgi:hypothetical protein